MEKSKYDSTLDITNPIHDKLFRSIPPGSTVLEFGPAYGRMTRHLKQALDCRVYIVELDPASCEAAGRYAEGVLCGDLEQLCWEDAFSGVEFDAVLFSDVLEHLRDPRSALRRARALLKPDGRLLAVVPNVAYRGVILSLLHGQFPYSELGILDNTHLRFFTKDSLSSLLRDSGFALDFLQGYENALHFSEFKQYGTDLPQPVLQYLGDRAESDVYQYMAIAKPAAADVPAHTAVQAVPGAIQSRLLFDTGSGFHMESGAEAVLSEGEGKTVAFRLPAGMDIHALRWYPALGRRLFCWDVALRSGDSRIVPHGGNMGDTISRMDAFADGDAWYAFDVRGKLSGCDHVSLEYSLDIDYGGTILSWALSEQRRRNTVQENHLCAVGQELRETLAALQATKAELEAAIPYKRMVEDYRKQAQALESELSHRQAHVDILSGALDKLTGSKIWRATWLARYAGSVVKKGYRRLTGRYLPGTYEYAQQKLGTFSRETVASPADEPCDASVSFIIPTWNGGEQLVRLVDMLRAQEDIGRKEIILVDSESTDGAVKKIGNTEDVTVYMIPKREFTHSASRNLGAGHAQGDVVVFITQDALPDGPLWARGMIEPILRGQAVAVSCRQKASEAANLYFKVGVWHQNRFMKMDQFDRVARMPPQGSDYTSWRYNAQLDNVACAVQRDICRTYPFRGQFAEDLDLGMRLIRDGHQLAFLASRQVLHTHRHRPDQTLRRTIMGVSAFRGILPMPPPAALSQQELLSRAIGGYGQVCHLCNAIKGANLPAMPMPEFKIWLDVALCGLEDDGGDFAAFDTVYDPFFHAELAALYTLYQKHPQAERAGIGRLLAAFWSGTLYPYIEAERLEPSAELLAEIEDCFRQHYAALLGEWLADYYALAPEADPLCQAAGRLGAWRNPAMHTEPAETNPQAREVAG